MFYCYCFYSKTEPFQSCHIKSDVLLCICDLELDSTPSYQKEKDSFGATLMVHFPKTNLV